MRLIFSSVATAALGLVVSTAQAGRGYDILTQFPDARQQAAFAGVVASAGFDCTTVNKFAYMGETPDGDFWTVRCGAEDYIVSLKGDANLSSTVLSCGMAKALNVECWRPF